MVIAIIAILAAILFPVFAQAKAAAKKTACLSNDKQQGLALYMYLNDFDDNLPMANYASSPNNVPSGFSYRAAKAAYIALNWADLIQPYCKNYQFFQCPVDLTGPYIVNGQPIPGYPLSYALNQYIFYLGPTAAFQGTLGAPMDSITEPASKLFIVESASNISQEVVDPVSTKRLGLNRHLGGANYVYCDTHAHYHVEPANWPLIPDATWKSSALAQKTGYNQWFPWTDGPEVW